MEKRKLGNSELEIAPFVLGGNVFGWTIDEQTSFAVLDGFLDAGFNMVDTADVYSSWAQGNKGGESETIIGKWLNSRGNRSKVNIATKVGSDMGADKSLKKSYILKAVESSLKRLQTDYIDLYQSHWDDLNTPVGETLDAYNELIGQGKVRVIGASNFSKERLKEAIDYSNKNNLPRYETFQPRYNMYDRDEYEKEYEQLCVQNNIGVIPYYGLASGFLSGKYRHKSDFSKSPRGGGMEKYMNERGMRILDALDEVSKKYQVQPATIALSWLMTRPGITAPIASATSKEQLNDLAKAATLKLDADSINQLTKASGY